MSNSDWKTVPGFCAWRKIDKETCDKLSQMLAVAAAKGKIERRRTHSKKYRGVRWSYHARDIEAMYRKLRGRLVLDTEEDERKDAQQVAEPTLLPPYHGADIIGIGSVILAAAALLTITAYIATRL